MSTSKSVIVLVICILGTTALICVATLAACMLLRITPDPVMLAAFTGLTGNVTGAITGLLVNTRTQSSEPIKAEITTKPEDPQ